jgi:SAM-dependent methyltransferase
MDVQKDMIEVYENTGCIICNSSDSDLIYSGKGQFGLPANVCVCKDCGFGFLNPRWNEETYFSFYVNVYDKYYRNKPISIPPEKNTSSYYPIYVRYIRNFSSFNPKNVLDIGSGNGELLSYLMQQNPAANYYAIESSLTCKEELKNRGIHFVSDDVNSDWEKSFDKKFDFVIMRHTLEHFLNPMRVLEKVRKALTDDSILYIAVPDSYNYPPPLKTSYFRAVHPYYYTKESLINVLKISGFNVIKCVEASKENNNQEMYCFAKVSDNIQPIAINSFNYHKQKRIYESGLKYENSLSYKITGCLRKFIFVITKIKKIFFPKTIIEKKIIII